MKRLITQLGVFLATNLNLVGFIKGKIYQGPLKNMCVPGLNCYSCPGALGACPIGALQAVIGSAKYHISLYVLGLLTLFGTMLGRFICGWLCPFGLVQDLLHRIKVKRLRVPAKLDSALRYVKYGVLVALVILFPMLLTDKYGIAKPFFCQYVCPSGTLLGGIPLLAANPGLRQAVGFLFSWKMGILIALLLVSVFIYRPFCKYLCPLGAVYALFNKVSFYRMHLDKNRCTHCKACERACNMQVPVTKSPNHTECIRCGACKKACPTGALSCGLKRNERKVHPGVTEGSNIDGLDQKSVGA